MKNYWVAKSKNRQIDVVEAYLLKTFNSVDVLRRPYPDGIKLFVKYLGVHAGNLIFEKGRWEIYYYKPNGDYSQEIIHDTYDTMSFWYTIQEKFNRSMSRSVISNVNVNKSLP